MIIFLIALISNYIKHYTTRPELSLDNIQMQDEFEK